MLMQYTKLYGILHAIALLLSQTLREEDIYGNLHTKGWIKNIKTSILYHINLRKSEKNIKELAITNFSS